MTSPVVSCNDQLLSSCCSRWRNFDGQKQVKFGNAVNCCQSASCNTRFSTMNPSSGKLSDAASKITSDPAFSQVSRRRYGVERICSTADHAPSFFRKRTEAQPIAEMRKSTGALTSNSSGRWFSISATLKPCWASPNAAAAPTIPPPTTTASKDLLEGFIFIQLDNGVHLTQLYRIFMPISEPKLPYRSGHNKSEGLHYAS